MAFGVCVFWGHFGCGVGDGMGDLYPRMVREYGIRYCDLVASWALFFKIDVHNLYHGF